MWIFWALVDREYDCTLKWGRSSSSSQRSVSVSTWVIITWSPLYWTRKVPGLVYIWDPPPRSPVTKLDSESNWLNIPICPDFLFLYPPYLLLKIFLFKNRLWEECFDHSVVLRDEALQHFGQASSFNDVGRLFLLWHILFCKTYIQSMKYHLKNSTWRTKCLILLKIKCYCPPLLRLL